MAIGIKESVELCVKWVNRLGCGVFANDGQGVVPFGCFVFFHLF